MLRTPILILPFLVSAALVAQTAPGTIQATGNANINVKPDQAQITVSVITEGPTAQAAATQNATQTTAVIAAINKTLGTSGSIQTVGYSIYPRSSNGSSPTIVGYTASNTLQITTTDLNLPGSLIDTANQAGANSVSNLSFGLQDPEPARQQALTAAGKQALAHASAIASGLGAKAGAVVSAQESSTVSSYPPGLTGVATVTPVVTGTVGVSATVVVTVQLQ